MQTIVITYQQTGKIHRYQGPSNWDEVTLKQFYAWAQICLKSVKLNDALKAAAFLFFKIKTKDFSTLTNDQRQQAGDLVKWLMLNECHQWKLENFRYGFEKYYGPANRLSNLTIQEFKYTETYYQAYQISNEVKYLDLLIAVLYREKAPKITGNDLRKEISDIDISIRAKKLKSLPGWKKYAILFNYEGCRNYIHNLPKYKNIFIKPKKKENEDVKAKPQFFDYDVLILNIAGGAFGNYHETGTINLYTFLDYLAKQKEDFDKIKS